MKRFITVVVLAVICFILQTTVFHWIELADVVPNLLLILTVSIGYMRGSKEAMFTGLLCGFLVDCMFGNVIGLSSLLYCCIGFIVGYANIIYVTEDYTLPIVMIGLGDLLYGFLYYVFSFLLRARLNFLFYLRRIIVPEMIYTVVVALVLYKIFHSINGLLEKWERKEA